jgi:hypothetical protein
MLKRSCEVADQQRTIEILKAATTFFVREAWCSTWEGWLYVAFILDVYMASWRRDAKGGSLVHHSDAGSQYTCVRYSDRLAGAGIAASIGTVATPTQRPRSRRSSLSHKGPGARRLSSSGRSSSGPSGTTPPGWDRQNHPAVTAGTHEQPLHETRYTSERLV